jgi:hypothetical protein
VSGKGKNQCKVPSHVKLRGKAIIKLEDEKEEYHNYYDLMEKMGENT